MQVERRAVRRRTTAIAGRAESGRARRPGRGRPRRRSVSRPRASAGSSAPCRTGSRRPRGPRPCRRASVLLEQHDLIAPGRQRARRRQPAETTADHADSRPDLVLSHCIGHCSCWWTAEPTRSSAVMRPRSVHVAVRCCADVRFRDARGGMPTPRPRSERAARDLRRSAAR